MADIVKALSLLVCLVFYALSATASEAPLKDVDVPMNNEAFRAGAATVTSVCVACHSLKYVKYRHLLDIGFSEQDLDGMRMGKGMNDFIDRLTPADSLKDSFGKVPPDLSVMAKARRGGARYIYSVLTGFYQKKDGSMDNHVFPGIRMPDPLGYGTASEADRKSIEKQVVEVASFLSWAADPHVLRRQRIGYWVIGYLIILTVLMYLVKKRIWARLD